MPFVALLSVLILIFGLLGIVAFTAKGILGTIALYLIIVMSLALAAFLFLAMRKSHTALFKDGENTKNHQ